MSLAVQQHGDPYGAGSIGVIRHGCSTLLVLAGPFDEFDSTAVTSLADSDVAAVEPHVIVDANGVTFLDGAFLGALVALEDVCRQRQGDLRITGAPAAMRRLCRLADLERLIDTDS